jgi:Icc-related predicted phosphoesterase
MLLYAVADIHGKLGKLSLIKKNVREHKPDMLIVAGDITNYFHPARTIEFIQGMPIPVLAVRGNSDFPIVETLISESSNISSLHLQKVFLEGIAFTGLGGTIPLPFRSKVSFREKRIFGRMVSKLEQQCVIVVHPPPFGVLDRVFGRFHAGSRILYAMITQHQPALCICGHIHEDVGSSFIGETLIVNCSMGRNGAGALIRFNHKEKSSVIFLEK